MKFVDLADEIVDAIVDHNRVDEVVDNRQMIDMNNKLGLIIRGVMIRMVGPMMMKHMLRQ